MLVIAEANNVNILRIYLRSLSTGFICDKVYNETRYILTTACYFERILVCTNLYSKIKLCFNNFVFLNFIF